MHDIHHEREREHPATVAYNTRLGLGLFALYLLMYVGYVGISTYAPAMMASQPFGGVNLAIIYGFALIAAALVLAVIYLVACKPTPVDGGT